MVIGKEIAGFKNLLTFTERSSTKTYIKKTKIRNPIQCNSELYKLIKEKN